MPVSQEVYVPKGESITGEERSMEIPEYNQSFIVLALRFGLTPDAIDTGFPTPGASVKRIVLLFVVLRDPYIL